jgi:nucleotide-binding universal stress UspA family protein
MVVLKSIIVGTDGSETATLAVDEAIALAKSTGGELHLVSGYEPAARARVAAPAAASAEAREWTIAPDAKVESVLDEAAARARMQGIDARVHTCKGDPADGLIDVAERENADLIVVGNRGMRGSRRFLLGSVPNKVSHHAPCSVLIVRTT